MPAFLSRSACPSSLVWRRCLRALAPSLPRARRCVMVVVWCSNNRCCWCVAVECGRDGEGVSGRGDVERRRQRRYQWGRDCGAGEVQTCVRSSPSPKPPARQRHPVNIGVLAFSRVPAPPSFPSPPPPAQKTTRRTSDQRKGRLSVYMACWKQKIVYTSRFVRVILAQGPC